MKTLAIVLLALCLILALGVMTYGYVIASWWLCLSGLVAALVLALPLIRLVKPVDDTEDQS